jgi:Fe-S cluster biogenesis protein NfuA
MSHNQKSVHVSYEPTPNPATLKFNLSERIIQSPHDFPSAQAAHNSPLAMKLFGFPWTSAVFIGPEFVTVTKQDWVDWEVLAEPLAGLIREHLESGEAVLSEAPPAGISDINENDSPIVKQIKQILNAEIRPVVAMDGGDIVFSNYQDGILSLHMKGSCAGCPSSTATLKQGIEARMQELLPEIKEVVSI